MEEGEKKLGVDGVLLDLEKCIILWLSFEKKGQLIKLKKSNGLN